MMHVKYLKSTHSDIHFDDVSLAFLHELSKELGEDVLIDDKEEVTEGSLPIFFILPGERKKSSSQDTPPFQGLSIF